MTMEPEPQPPSDRVTPVDVARLSEDIAGLRQDLYGGDPSGRAGVIGFLRSGYRGNRWRIRLIILSLTLDLILTALIVLGANGANNACRAGNESRAAQRNLWTHVLQIDAQQKLDTRQQAALNQFRLYVDQNFAARHCSFWSNL